MNRRSFLRTTILGIGAALTVASVGFNTFCVEERLKPRNKNPFPVWDVKWRQPWMRGYVAQTKMNIPEGMLPPQVRPWNGIQYDLFRADPARNKAWYYKRV